MAIQSTTNINVDFYDKKYILINAKQLDKNSRFLSVTCYNNGELYQLYAGEHSAYIRYKKPDGYSVFNLCDINAKGKILVELTEQMLATDGICYADLVIVDKGDARVDTNTGEIIAIDNTAILSTMTFCIDVSETPVLNSDIESSYEHDALNDLLEKAEADYKEVILTSKSYAVGNADGIRPNEDKDNSKYYYEQSLKYSGESEKSALSADASATKAEEYMHNALVSEQNAQTYMGNAKSYMDSAKISEQNAYTSETNAKTSETNAKTNEQNALSYMNSAEDYRDAAYNHAIISQRYAVGGTNTVTDEDIDNAKYYYEQARNIVIGASVIGVKGNNEEIYRTGNVNLTAENIGAVSSADIAAVDEVKGYLGIE